VDKPSDIGVLEEFRLEFLDYWERLPNKGFFLALLTAWLALFQFLGSSTLGYVRTPSLFYWMYDAYSGGGHLAESDEAYGVLVPFGVLVLFWLKRRELLAGKLTIWWPALGLVAAGLLLHTLGYLVQQPRISVIGLFTGLYGLSGLAWGLDWLRASFFPFFLFAFCVPLGSLAQAITFPLRLLVTGMVEQFCHFLLAIDVVRQGTMLIDPSGHYQYDVEAACSGIRSLAATLLFAIALAFFSFRSWWKRLVLMGSAVPLAIFGNFLRLLAIVLAADIWGQEAGNRVHEGGPGGIYVLLLYIPGFVGLLMIENYLHKKGQAAATNGLEPRAARVVATHEH
jgi:exosortase